jgi:hypothetical protein
MVKRARAAGHRMSPFCFADPARPDTLPLPRCEAFNLERELTTLVESILRAGAKVHELVKVGFDVQTKSDRSPVTAVDHEVNRILHEMQERAFHSMVGSRKSLLTIWLDSPVSASGL